MIEFKVQSSRFHVRALRAAGRPARPIWRRVADRRQSRALNFEPGTLDSSQGLTLIEVMIALAILSIGLTVLIATASKCLSVVRQAKNYEAARNLLARIEVEHPLQLADKIEAGSDNGTFSGEFSGYGWSRNVESVGDEEDGLFMVTMRVSWSERGQAAFEEVVSYIYAPEKKEGGSFVSRK